MQKKMEWIWIGFGFDLDSIWIEIGVFKNFKECARSPCNGNHFSSWASEGSPTLGFSIEISGDIILLVCRMSHVGCPSYVKLTA